MFVFAASCRVSGPATAPSHPAPLATYGESPRSTAVVGFRIEFGAPATRSRFRVVALVSDTTGKETSTDLGTYVGRVEHEDPTGAELLRLRVHGAPVAGVNDATLQVIPGEKGVEVWREQGGERELLQRIDVPANDARAHDTPVQTEEPPSGP